jgi:ketosteroid isomerase-like protein
MLLSRNEFKNALKEWNLSSNAHDLGGVMNFIHDDVLFENWTGGKVIGNETLTKAWVTWFANHGGFRFTEKEIFIDEKDQKVLFRWVL